MNRGQRDRVRRLFADLFRTIDALVEAHANAAPKADLRHARLEVQQTCEALAEAVCADD